ncbi:protein FAM220A [Equus quagga]|uniref:protein FAM220A n=1 Tax=Equus quagga TaxID=89248 RepID=UPI001EE1CDD8|nr:protein FAM220A [Equus quagga]
MRDGRGTLGTCLAKVKGGGEDVATLLRRLRRTQKGGPRPSGDVPSWVIKPAVDVNGNSQNEEMKSLEMKNDPSEFNLLSHHGSKVLPSLEESLRRNSASAAAQSKIVDLFFAPVEERFAWVSCGVGEALVRDWLGGGPRATDGHKGRCHKGKPWESGLPCHQERSEMGISEDAPPSAILEGLGPELELSGLHCTLSTLLHARPEIFLNDETKPVFLGHSKPTSSEQTVEDKKVLSSVKSPSCGLQMTLGLLALQAFELAKPSRHS